MSLSLFGLVCIALAWLYQLYCIFKHGNRIKPLFILFYAIGVIFLITDEYLKGSTLSPSGMLNTVSLLLVMTMFLILFVRKR